MPKKVLFLPLEFSRWEKARYNGYTLMMGLEEVLSQSGCELSVVPAVCETSYAELPPATLCPWFRYLPQLVGDRRFDHLWLEVVHTNMDDSFLQWLSTLAPVRVGFIGESLSYSEQTFAMHPVLRLREKLVLSRAKYLTHALVWDELDIEKLSRANPALTVMWWPQMVPARLLALEAGPILHQSGVFVGSLYGERVAWMQHPEVQRVVRVLPPPEENSRYPTLFDQTQAQLESDLAQKRSDLWQLLEAHLLNIKRARRAIFDMWINTLRDSAVVVNLPQMGSGYAGRVIEALACGRPVVTKAPAGRPRPALLFEPGVEIFHYSAPSELVQCVKHLLENPEIAAQSAARARQKIAVALLTEDLVKQLLQY